MSTQPPNGTSWEECTAYIYSNLMDVTAWRQTKDKIVINLKGGATPGGSAPKADAIPLSESNADPKSKLNQFCQKKCRAMIGKADVVYAADQVQGEDGKPAFQASVTLNCLEGISFAGAVCSDRKSAEKSAAQEALNHYEDDEAMLVSAPKKRKTKDTSEATEAKEGEDAPAKVTTPATKVVSQYAGLASDSPKSQLNTAMSKMLKRVLSKADVVYETEKVEGAGYQCTVKLPCLNGEWASMSWTGEALQKKTDAEHSAAAIAVTALKNYTP